MKNKKAAFDIKDLPWLTITFGVGVIVLAVASSIIGDIRDDYTRPSLSVVNESDGTTLLWYNQTNMTLDQVNIVSVTVFNCTAGDDYSTISSSYYTLYADVGYIMPLNNGTYQDATPVCVNYTHYVNDAPYNITIKGNRGQLNFSTWFTTLGLVLGAIVVLSTLMYLGFIRKG